VRAAVVLLVSLATLSGLRFLVDIAMLARDTHGPDDVTLYEHRFDVLRPMLPRQGTVGYVTDRPEAAREFFLTQYALAPLIVVAHARAPLVIGNFFDPDAGPAVAAAHGLALLRDFGDGVALFRGPSG
jgi:fermentation-respiration switch protein FrsA (DUF1100 family)